MVKKKVSKLKSKKTSTQKSKNLSVKSDKQKNKSSKFSAKDFRKLICTLSEALEKEQLNPVLVGEACSAIYSSNKFVPKTIEFVISRVTIPKLKRLMSSVGFKSQDIRSFKSNVYPYQILISPPPLSVGDELVETVKHLKDKGCGFDALSPTDCIRHRLAHYYRWGDEEVLMQAVAVAKDNNKIDYELIRRWSEWEWADDRYQKFLKLVGVKNGSSSK